LADAEPHIHLDADYVVIDRFMEPNALRTLHDHVKRETFFYENAFEWNRVWHPLEGQALVTGPRSYGNTERPGARYPTETPYDLFFQTMEQHSAMIAELVGCPEAAIRYVVAAYLYRAGWSLPWHDDAGDYRGAFAFYIHDEWKANWGGELMILTEERLFEPREGAIDLGFKQGAGFPQPAFAQHGKGEFVMPSPNRIVFMRRALIHSINRVSPLAGENMRFSLSGFFL
jgi:hypothetical protein